MHRKQISNMVPVYTLFIKMPGVTLTEVIRVILTATICMHIQPDCTMSLSCMSMTIQCSPLSRPAGFRWKVSLMALTSSVTLTKPLCCSGMSSPKSLCGAKTNSTGEISTVRSPHIFHYHLSSASLHRISLVLKLLAS